MSEIYLISIKPRYAYRIFTGVKKYELRRYLGLKPSTGSLMIVYVSGKVKAVLGEFKAGRVFYGSPEEIWSILRNIGDTGVGLDDFKYIQGSKQALAIEIVEPKLYYKPLKLDELRRIIPGFEPPLSMVRIDEYDPVYELVIRKAREYIYKGKNSLKSP